MRVGVIANRDKDKHLTVSREICARFNDHGVFCMICEQEQSSKKNYYTDPKKLADKIDLVITVGGDGTLIQAARDLHTLELPIIGVNMGTLGFLAELSVKSIPDAVERICAGDFFLEEHMMILGDIYRGERCIFSDVALNDAVLTKYGHAHVIHFDVYVDDQLLSSYAADGLIISTPTGSSAYNMSAGGPLIVPNASMMVMTPICAHALNARSIVLPDSASIRIMIKDRQHPFPAGCAINYDGAVVRRLSPGDVVKLKKAPVTTKFLCLDHTSFFKVLQKKMSTL